MLLTVSPQYSSVSSTSFWNAAHNISGCVKAYARSSWFLTSICRVVLSTGRQSGGIPSTSGFGGSTSVVRALHAGDHPTQARPQSTRKRVELFQTASIHSLLWASRHVVPIVRPRSQNATSTYQFATYNMLEATCVCLARLE